MTPIQYKAAKRRLGLSHSGVARLFVVHPRTSRRWQSGEAPIPKSVEIAMVLLAKQKAPADFIDTRRPVK